MKSAEEKRGKRHRRLGDILRDRITGLKLDRETAQAALDRIRAQAIPATEILSEIIERFWREMRENIANGEMPFRKAYLRSVLDRIEIDDHVVRVIRDTATLERVVTGKSVPAVGIRSFVCEWRAI